MVQLSQIQFEINRVLQQTKKECILEILLTHQTLSKKKKSNIFMHSYLIKLNNYFIEI